jgi:peroxiredoxin
MNMLRFLLFLFLLMPGPARATTQLKVGDKVPDFTLTDPTGKSIHLYELQGKIVLLDFWASWCGPCREANKDLIKVYKDFNPQGFEIFSVSLDSKKEPWLKAIEKDKLAWPYHGSDFKEWESAPAQLFGINEIPTTFLLDENGIILAKSHDPEEIRQKLNYIYFEQSNAYPLNTSGKIYFSDKSKYEISDADGKSVLKGKDAEVDVSGLPTGEYLLKYNEKITFFQKLDPPATPIVLDSNATGPILDLSSPASLYEIYSLRGKLIKKGKGKEIPVADLKPGPYFVNLDGIISRYIKK